MSFFLLSFGAYSKCNFFQKDYIEKLEDLTSIKKITISTLAHKSWAANSLKILADRRNVISKKFKKRFDAEIEVEYEFGSCFMKARIRQHGDYKDHINFSDGGKLISSVDVRLSDNNLLRSPSFKLLLPKTRLGDAEIFGTELLKALGFLVPETFLIPVEINGTNKVLMFQENPTKEFLERNKRREGPIFSGNERFLWRYEEFEPFALEEIALGKMKNFNWLKKEKNSVRVSLQAFYQIQTSYKEHLVNFPENWVLVQPNENGNALFFDYAVLLMALNGEHALRPHNQRFYYNVFLRGFEPIYYDGNILIKNRLRMKYASTKDIERIYLNANLEKLQSFQTKIEGKDFWDKLKDDFTKRTLFSQNNSTKNFLAYKKNFKNVFNKIVSEIIIEQNQKVAKNIPIPKDYAQQIINERLVKNNISGWIITDVREIQTGFELLARHTISGKIQGTKLNKDDLAKVIKSLKLWDENIFFMPSRVSLNDRKLKEESFLEGSIIRSKGISLEVNDKRKIIKINQNHPSDFIVFSDIYFKDWTINFFGVLNNSKPRNVNRTGITGCLNFFNSKFNGTKIYAKNGLCEDTLNIVSSTGSFSNIEVYNSYADATDFDFSDVVVDSLLVENAGNDCIDVSSGKYLFETVDANKCQDKGISVGEGSSFDADNVSISEAEIGVSSKDSSFATIKNLTLNMVRICLEAKKKKQEFNGAYVNVSKLNCSGEIMNDRVSSIDIGFKNEF